MLLLVVLSDKNVTRVTVFFWGMTLIAMAGFIAYELSRWHPIAETLLAQAGKQKLTKEGFAEFDRISTLLLWLVPFFTGSLGTNLISDALTKPLEYRKPFNPVRLALSIIQGTWMLVQFIAVCLMTPLLICIGIYKGVRNIRLKKRWKVYSRLYRRNYVRKYPRALPPAER